MTDQNFLQNLNKALTRFNIMYERVTTTNASHDEAIVVYRYGTFLVGLYEEVDIFDETNEKLRALKYFIIEKKTVIK